MAALLPQLDGSLIVMGANGGNLLVWRVRPPNDSLSDSVSIAIDGDEATLATVIASTAGTVGDRIYVGGGERVIAVNTRDFSTPLNVDVGDPVHALAFTPRGDRIFVAIAGEPLLQIGDRFEEGGSGPG